MNSIPKPALFIVALVVIAGGIYYFESHKVRPAPLPVGSTDIMPRSGMVNTTTPGVVQNIPPVAPVKKNYPIAKEISTPDGFINADKSLTIQSLIGKKVILVDFWTYSCINCQRTQPYLNAWYEKYKDAGLEIIGIHTPEFDFEKKYDNVVAAVKKENIKYPVVLDNDFSTWQAYENQYWPRKYLIDIDGYIVYDVIGEGSYIQTEKKIQELLNERMKVLGEEGKIANDISKPTDAVSVDPVRLGSPEIYFGSERSGLTQNKVELSGVWNITPEYAESPSNAKITYRYSAKNVYMVASAAGGMDIKILVDGKVVNEKFHIEAHDLYHLVSGDDYGVHTLEIIIPKSGFRAFTFTFG